MTDPEASFVHKPVDRYLQEIRLLCVIPEAGGPIECKIKHVNLQSNQTPDYRALSYTWGAPDPVQKITINNQLFLVRQNLYDFLEAFRARLYRFRGCGDYENDVQWLWIDQICIDQSVFEERNYQVEMMSDIYRRASYVYVWLGKSDTCIESVMKTVKADFRRYHDDDPAARKLGRDEIAGQDKSLTNESPTTDLAGPALQHFFGNPYWFRLWIVQEIMLARYIRVICGETLLSWEELRRFCSSGLKRLSSEAARAVPLQVIWLTLNALSGRQFTFSSLVQALGTSGCQNPRDKVYALQGMVQCEDRPIVHYERSVTKVFQDAVRTMISTAIRNSRGRNGTDLSRINYTGSMKNAFLDAAALWMKELEGVIHLEMFEAWIVLRKEMGLSTIEDSFAERSHLLKDVRAVWSRLAHIHLRVFLSKYRSQHTGTEGFEDDISNNMTLDPESSETLIAQLRGHYDALVKILRMIKNLALRPDDYYDDGLFYPENLKTYFGRPWYCDRQCSEPARVHVIP